MGLYDSFKLSDSQYVPAFAGLPLEQIQKTGDVLAARHYENLAKESQLGLLAHQLKANAESDADKGYVDTHISSIQSALQDIARNGGENSTARVSALTNHFLGDEGLQIIQKNAQARQREKEEAEKLRISGKTPIFNEKYKEQFKQRGSYNPETGKWENYDPSVQERLDYIKKQDQILDPLQADISQSDLKGDLKTTLNALGANYSGDLGSMPTHLKTTVLKTLSRKKIMDFINNKGGWDAYKDTGEYKQQKDILGMNDDEIKSELLSRGEAKVFSHISKDWMSNKAFDFKAAQKATAPDLLAGEQLANVTIPYTPKLANLDRFDAIERGGGTTYVNPLATVQGGTVEARYTGPQKGISDKEWSDFRGLAKTGAAIFGKGDSTDWDKLSEKSTPQELAKAKEYANAYQGFLKDRQLFMTQDVSFTQREGEEGRSNADDITKDVRNNIENRAIYDMETGKLIPVKGTSEGEFSDDFQDTIGGRDRITVTGSLDPKNYVAKQLNNPRFADAYTAIVEDPKDPAKTRRVLITRKEYPAGQQRLASVINREINKVYSTVNAEPGSQKELSVFGKKVKATELIGNQWNDFLSQMSPEEQAVAGSFQYPILAHVPGSEEPMLFNGPEHLTEYLRTHK